SPTLKTIVNTTVWEEMEKIGMEAEKATKSVKKHYKQSKSKGKHKHKNKDKDKYGVETQQTIIHPEELTSTSLSAVLPQISKSDEKQDEFDEPMTSLSPAPSDPLSPRFEESSQNERRPTSRPRIRKKFTWAKQIGEDSQVNELPLFRRATRYPCSPIRISPLNNGQEYSIQIKAVTLTEIKVTKWSDQVIPKGVPPPPSITKLLPRQNSAMIAFDCADFGIEEFRAKYDVESIPATIPMKDCIHSPIVFKGLRNGVNYKFVVCARNKEGKSQWSQPSVGITPLMVPPQPVYLTCVPFDSEVALFWACEELGMPEYQGWYEAVSDPPTYTMMTNRQQARFRFLKNESSYTFKVYAVNPVARRESEWSSPCQPTNGGTKTAYLREKKRVACLMRERVLQDRKLRLQRKAQEKQAIHQKKREVLQNMEEKESKSVIQKKLDRKKKRKEREREEGGGKRKQNKNKKKDGEGRYGGQKQRKKVLLNKRRISMLHQERIDAVQFQWNPHGANTRLLSIATEPSIMADAQKAKLKNTKSGTKTPKNSMSPTSPKTRSNQQDQQLTIRLNQSERSPKSPSSPNKSPSSSNKSPTSNRSSKSPKVRQTQLSPTKSNSREKSPKRGNPKKNGSDIKEDEKID
ncbi:zinc finger protein CCCH domain-containing protein, partial [Reticulomyxa filosa]